MYPHMAREYRFLISLSLTLVIETALLIVILKTGLFGKNKERISVKLIVFSGILASLTTLPYVWFLFPRFFSGRIPFLAAAETFAVLCEAVIYSFILKIRFDKALLCSFLCNMASFFSGLLLNRFL